MILFLAIVIVGAILAPMVIPVVWYFPAYLFFVVLVRFYKKEWRWYYVLDYVAVVGITDKVFSFVFWAIVVWSLF